MIRFIHGFNVWDGGWSSLGPLRDGYRQRGHLTEIFSWGQSTLFSVRLKTNGAIERFVQRQVHYPARVWVGHSHGAYVATRAFELLPDSVQRPEAIILIQPAMRRSYHLPEGTRFVVRYNPHDFAVLAGKAWRTVNPLAWLTSHPWGTAGRYGFDAIPEGSIQIDTSSDIHAGRAIRGHSPHGGYGHYWAGIDLELAGTLPPVGCMR